MEIINLGVRDGLPPAEWGAVVETLADGAAPAPDAHDARTTWLTTVNEDGSPHVTAVSALWLDGAFWFQTGTGTRKSRNIARDPRCSIAVSMRDADVVVEGSATRVTDSASVARVAKGVGGQRVAGGTRSERDRHHRAVQCAVAGTTAVERVSHRAPLGDRDDGHGAGRSDPLHLLTATIA
jgi:Pyridoxamine 5'-phosphate oxidase